MGALDVPHPEHVRSMKASRLLVLLSVALGTHAAVARAELTTPCDGTPVANACAASSPLERSFAAMLHRDTGLTARPAHRRGTLRMHVTAAPGHTLVHTAHARRHAHAHLAKLHRHDNAHTLARSERPAPAQHPRDHAAPPAPPAPTQVNFHRHGPDSRGSAFALPVSHDLGAVMRGAIAMNREHPRVIRGESPVHVGRGPPARGTTPTPRLAAARPASPRRALPARRPSRPAPHARSIAMRLRHARRPMSARARFARAPLRSTLDVVSPEPCGSRVRSPGGSSNALLQASTGERS